MKQQLHSGARWSFRIGAYIILGFIGIWLSFFSYWFLGIMIVILRGGATTISASSIISIVLGVIVLWFIFVFGVGEIYARMAYNRWFYEFTPDNLKVEKGIIWKRYANIPYERVQNVDVTRGILARLLGFSTLNIQTAGYSYSSRGLPISEGHIPAVYPEQAEKIREFLMKKISKRHHGRDESGGL